MLIDTEASCLAIALAVCLKKKEKQRRWMKEWLKKRNEYTHENLLKDLRLSEPSDFQNFLRLDATSFDELLKIVMSRIEKWNTTMQDAISPSQHLSITLLSPYLQSSCSYCSFFFHSVAVILALDIPQSR
jgi:coproporphyrinogen III oxidase-like Fe-S oxidoreductase